MNGANGATAVRVAVLAPSSRHSRSHRTRFQLERHAKQPILNNGREPVTHMCVLKIAKEVGVPGASAAPLAIQGPSLQFIPSPKTRLVPAKHVKPVMVKKEPKTA